MYIMCLRQLQPAQVLQDFTLTWTTNNSYFSNIFLNQSQVFQWSIRIPEDEDEKTLYRHYFELSSLKETQTEDTLQTTSIDDCTDNVLLPLSFPFIYLSTYNSLTTEGKIKYFILVSLYHESEFIWDFMINHCFKKKI